MREAVIDLFDRYERAFNAALGGEPALDAIAGFYTDAFIAASPAGVVTGEQGDELRKMMAAGFERYRKLRTRDMEARDVRVELIDDLHALAHVDWRATYDIAGNTKAIDFTNIYFTRVEDGRAQVFGWITGDEQALLREHGITA